MTECWPAVEQQIRDRAADRCEYCLMHQRMQVATFHIEHILPRSAGGPSTIENLAWACPSCNLHKSSRVAATNPLSDTDVALFHPRRERWHDHFAWRGYEIVGLTATGRATAAALQLNSNRRIQARIAEEVFKIFPPPQGLMNQ